MRLRAFATVVMVAFVTRPSAAQSPAMFRGDLAHTGHYREPLGRELVGLQWRFDTDGSIIATPTVQGDTIWIGGSDGRLYALDRLTGRVRWRTDLGAPIASTAAVAGGRVIVGTRDGRFHGLASSTGRRLWRLETGPDLPFPWGRESGDLWTASPVVAGSVVVVGAGDGRVRALDLATGRVRWTAATEGRIRSTPAVAAGRVFVGSADGHLYCFDLATGTRRWRYATLGASLESGRFGFDRRTIQSSPAVSGGTVFIGARDGFHYAIDAATGELRWKVDHEVSWVNGSAAIGDGVLYVGTSDGQFLQAVDIATGREKWRTPTAATIWSSAALVRDQVIVGDGAGRVRSYDAATGAVRWSFFTGANVFSSPVPAGNLVVVGSSDGGVYAIRTGDAPVHRAVFVDTAGPVRATPDEAALARTLSERGYRTLGGAELIRFLEARIADRAPSVVAVATDNLPAEAVAEPLERSLLRRYLDAGGKVVWTRLPPLIYPRDSTGQRTGGLGAFRWDAPGRLLGMRLAGGIFDQRLAVPTEAGRRWGLVFRWRDGWGIDPAEPTEVLALDDWRLAASWVKSFGGPPGTGFVRAPADPRSFYLLSEYRPAR